MPSNVKKEEVAPSRTVEIHLTTLGRMQDKHVEYNYQTGAFETIEAELTEDILDLPSRIIHRSELKTINEREEG